MARSGTGHTLAIQSRCRTTVGLRTCEQRAAVDLDSQVRKAFVSEWAVGRVVESLREEMFDCMTTLQRQGE